MKVVVNDSEKTPDFIRKDRWKYSECFRFLILVALTPHVHPIWLVGYPCKIGVVGMDDFMKPEMQNLGLSFAQFGSDATRRLCEQSQNFARAFNDWNTEVRDFLSHRTTRNLDALARMAKCNMQEALSVQADWMRETVDDYAREIGKLLEVNRNVISDALKPVQEAVVQATERARSSSARVPMKVTD